MISDTLLLHLLIAAIILAGFAYAYNRWIDSLADSGRADGFVSLLVAGGTAVTLLIGLIVAAADGAAALRGALIVLILFIPSGIPMILGSIRRYVDRRADDQEAAHAAASQATEDR